MRAIKVIFALSVAIPGIFGCSSTERLYYRTLTSTVELPQAKASAPSSLDSPSNASSPNSDPLSDQTPSIRERNSLARAPEVSPMPPPKPLGAAPERAARPAKPAAPNKPPVAEPQSPREFRADNRLLELLEKDLDKAVEQPKESRRLQFSKEVIDNPKVRHFVKYYSSTGKNRFQEILGRSGKYMPMIAKVLNQEGLPEELGYLALLESEFVVDNTSRNGAVGLWQFIAATARRYGLRIDDWVDERRDPVKSTRAAAAYLKDLHDHFGRWYLATAAYNAGPANIDKALQKSGAKDFWSIKAKAQLTEETRNFVPKFVAIALIAMDPKKYGLNDVRYEPSLDYEEVEINRPVQLATLAELAETDVSVIKELNPGLLRPSTPPGETSFRVNLPVGKSPVFLAKLNERKPERDAEPPRVVTHEVKRGETLLSIARFYGLDVRALMDFNGLTTSRIRIGQKLRILLEGLRGALR